MRKKSGKHSKINIALSELRKMLPFYAVGGLLLIAVSAVYCISVRSFDYRLFSGIAAGCAASAGYFLMLGYSAESALRRKDNKKARFSANLWYGSRYAGLFAVYVLLLIFNLVNIITAVIPLFFPRIYYLLTLIKKENIQ